MLEERLTWGIGGSVKRNPFVSKKGQIISTVGIPKFAPVLSLQYLASGVTDGDYELSFVSFS